LKVRLFVAEEAAKKTTPCLILSFFEGFSDFFRKKNLPARVELL